MVHYHSERKQERAVALANFRGILAWIALASVSIAGILRVYRAVYQAYYVQKREKEMRNKHKCLHYYLLVNKRK